MKKINLILIVIILGINPYSRADEGMWLPMFVERLNYVDMQKEGLNLTAEEIYSINHSSLKDAIAIFGRGCTSEIISEEGLLLTNHHCGYGNIQAHSSVEHDYLADGFWAMSREEELPNEGLTTKFLVRIEDVTEKVLANVKADMTEEERYSSIDKISSEISSDAEEGTDYDAAVRSFFAGNEFYLFVYSVYRDVRLVGAPPSSIGKFGADTDNWMWPRHTADFSMFRVYTDKDGNPADYSKDNIPFKPKHSLPVSLAGVKEGDFAMILGYPGGTDRYMTSYGIKMALDISNQTIVDIRDVKLKIMMADMQADQAVRIQYASKYARTANYWKYFIGQTKGLKKLKVYDKKVELENEFSAWVDASGKKEKYGKALSDNATAYDELSKYELARIYKSEAIRRGSEILGFSNGYASLKDALLKKDVNQEEVDKMIAGLKEQSEAYFKDYNQSTDEKLLAAMLKMYSENVPSGQQSEYLKKINSKYKGDFSAFAKKLFAASNFATSEKVNLLLEKPSAKIIEKDPAFALITAINNHYDKEIQPEITEAYNLLDRGDRLFVAGLREMQPDKKFYPDANFTMRLTYGQVLPYNPADAISFNYYTTLKGVMEKEDPNNWEFVVPQKLKDLYNDKDYGPYGEDGKMHTCFLSNLDITGGNSGSPVINGNGELIGLAFDGNWEAMSGDIAFEPKIQRTISVDIRYVLFIIDKFAGATHLIDEMNLVKRKPSPSKEARETSLEVAPVQKER
ncbi:MAG: serine protease [Bacteroidetes bacterium]|nr:MAG: serine protease [Bacteroidota bacterium]